MKKQAVAIVSIFLAIAGIATHQPICKAGDLHQPSVELQSGDDGNGNDEFHRGSGR